MNSPSIVDVAMLVIGIAQLVNVAWSKTERNQLLAVRIRGTVLGVVLILNGVRGIAVPDTWLHQAIGVAALVALALYVGSFLFQSEIERRAEHRT